MPIKLYTPLLCITRILMSSVKVVKTLLTIKIATTKKPSIYLAILSGGINLTKHSISWSYSHSLVSKGCKLSNKYSKCVFNNFGHQAPGCNNLCSSPCYTNAKMVCLINIFIRARIMTRTA